MSSGERPAVGDAVVGKYRLIRRIGAGGMAEVFLAQQTGLDGFEKLVVIKRILPHMAEQRQFVRMFLDEARTAADLRHPNIVQIFDVGEADGSYFLAMEYLNGENLRTIQKKLHDTGETMPLPHVLQVGRDLAEALHYAHAKTDLKGRPLGIVHRDVSPHNVLLTFDGVVKLLDFGIAKASSKTVHTAPGMVMGKVDYMSPEQAYGKTLDGRSDQFALGIVLYELSTGRTLFGRDSDAATLQAITSGEVTAPSQIVADFPPALEQILLRMLSRDSTDRYADCGEVATALESFMGTSGHVPSRRAMSTWLRELFPGSRDVPAGRPARQKTAAMESAETAATLASAPQADERVSGPSLVDRPMVADAEVGAKPPRPQSRGPWMAGAVVVILGALVALVLGVMRPWESGGPASTATSTPTITTTAAVASTPTVAKTPGVQKTVVVTVTATPRPTPKVVARYGRLTVKARGGWAQVFVDGKRVARETPLMGHRLRAGTHDLVVKTPPAGLTLTRKVRIRANGTTTVIVDVQARTLRVQ